MDRGRTASLVDERSMGGKLEKDPRRLHVEREARRARPGQGAVRGWGSAPVVAPHGLGKHGGRPCDLERELGREIAQRRNDAARTHTHARAQRGATMGEAEAGGQVHAAHDRWKETVL